MSDVYLPGKYQYYLNITNSASHLIHIHVDCDVEFILLTTKAGPVATGMSRRIHLLVEEGPEGEHRGDVVITVTDQRRQPSQRIRVPIYLNIKPRPDKLPFIPAHHALPPACPVDGYQFIE